MRTTSTTTTSVDDIPDENPAMPPATSVDDFPDANPAMPPTTSVDDSPATAVLGAATSMKKLNTNFC